METEGNGQISRCSTAYREAEAQTLNASNSRLLPNPDLCLSLSKPTILCRCYTSRVPYLLHFRSCHYRYRSSQAKRAHTHHIDLYWVVFHLLQNFSARFFSSCVVTAYCIPRTREIDDIKFSLLQSFLLVGRSSAERSVVRSNLRTATMARERSRSPTAAYGFSSFISTIIIFI